jgi:hypothetical protein
VPSRSQPALGPISASRPSALLIRLRSNGQEEENLGAADLDPLPSPRELTGHRCRSEQFPANGRPQKGLGAVDLDQAADRRCRLRRSRTGWAKRCRPVLRPPRAGPHRSADRARVVLAEAPPSPGLSSPAAQHFVLYCFTRCPARGGRVGAVSRRKQRGQGANFPTLGDDSVKLSRGFSNEPTSACSISLGPGRIGPLVRSLSD